MRKFSNSLFAVFMFAMLIFASNTQAQSTANYVFTTATNGSLTDMTGATQIVAAGVDDGVSAIQTMPFNFYLMGTAYTQFSTSSNGFMRLGGTVVSGTQYSLGTAGMALIASFGSDEITQVGAGGIFYLVTGSAPNRVLTVEFRNMTVIYDAAGATGDATSQVRLYEGTGVIELVYGSISRNSSTGFSGSMDPQYVGFSTGSAANTYATVTTSTATVSTTTVTSNQYTLGAPVAELTSAAQGSRVVYTFTPPVPLAPTNLSFSDVTATATTLNWVDNATNEMGYSIFKSTDGVTYTAAGTVAANVVTSVQTGLLPSTNYYWRVVALSEGTTSTPLDGQQMTSAPGNITSNGTGGGLWSAGSSWIGGVAPSSGDNVIISAGDNITLDMTTSTLSLDVNGSLTYDVTTARTLNVAVNLTIGAAGSVTTGASGSVTAHVLSVAGDLTNSGTLDLFIGTAATTLNFAGSNNSNYTGAGAVNDLYILTFSKSSRAQIVELDLTNFTVRGLSAAATGALLTSGATVGTGTLKFSGSNTFNGNLWSIAGYTIPATFGLWINNANFTVNGQNGSPTLAGLFRISAGTYNIGTATGNSMGFSGASVITVEGGAVNATGRFGVGAAANVINYTQTGGTVTVCTIGNTSTALGSFDLGTGTGSSVLLSGGTIVVQTRSTAASGPRDYRYQSATGISAIPVSGTCTLQLGNALSGATPLAFTITGVLPNLVITNTSANHTCTINSTLVNWNVATRNLTINAGTTLTILNNIFLFAGNSIVNNGTLVANGASCRFITFEVGTNISYSGSGVVTAPMTSLELQNDLNFTIDPTSPNIPVLRVITFSGSFVNANKLTLGNGGTTTATTQIGNTTAILGGGGFDVLPTFNLGTGGQNVSALRTSNTIDLNTIVNPTRTINNLTIDPDAGRTVNLTGGNLQVNTNLSLTTGFLDLNGNTLTLGTSAATPGTLTGSVTNVINGTFKRWLNTVTGNIIFPIGITFDAGDAPKTGTQTEFSKARFYSPSIGELVGTVGYEVQPEETKATEKNTKKGTGSDLTTDGAPVNVSRVAQVLYTAAPVTGGTLSAQWISTPGGTNGLPLSEGGINVTTTSVDGFWRFTAGDGLSGGTYDIICDATGILGVTDYTQLVLLKRTDASSPWILDGTHVTTTGSNGAPVLSRTGITTGFSDFAVGGDQSINPLPVELSSFVSSTDRNKVELKWTTVSEDNNAGFDVERKLVSETQWAKVGNVAGRGNSNTPVNYTFTENLASGKYNYRLKQVDYNGNFKYYSLSSEINVGVPGKFALSQNYPNPFNPSTKINYDLPFDSKVAVKIFDMTGKEVAVLLNQVQTAGYHTINFNAANLSSGVYFYQINADGGSQNFVKTLKMMLIK